MQRPKRVGSARLTELENSSDTCGPSTSDIHQVSERGRERARVGKFSREEKQKKRKSDSEKMRRDGRREYRRGGEAREAVMIAYAARERDLHKLTPCSPTS